MKSCPFCAEEIQDAAIICKHCGRELAQATPTTNDGLSRPAAANSNPGRLLLFASVAVIAVGVLVQQMTHQAAGAQQGSAQPLVVEPRTIGIVSASDIDVPAGAIQRFDWVIPADQPNCQLSGQIEVTEGGNRDVQVFVVTADEYKNLANGHTARTFLATEKTTVVNLDVRLNTAGPMVLAIGNTFSALTDKHVQIRDVKATCY